MMDLRACFWRTLVVGLIISPTSAFGAAWTLVGGHGQVIVTATASRADEAFDGLRNTQPTSRYEKLDLSALLEYGVTDSLTLILSPGVQHVSIEAPAGSTDGNPPHVEFGARYRFANGDNWVLSGQTSLLQTGSSDIANTTPLDKSGTEVDVRGLFGYSFSVAHKPAFVDVQIAQRFRSGGSPDEIRADVTFGLRPSSKWLLLAQSFNVVSEGAGAPGFPRYDYFKAQPSVVYELTEGWAIQAGVFTTYAGRRSIQENGLLLAVWCNF